MFSHFILLLLSPADLNIKTKNGDTAMLIALKRNCFRTARLLLKKEAGNISDEKDIMW